MAPTTPSRSPQLSHREKALARLADPTLPRKVHRNGNAVTDSFLQSKRDKKLIRKSAFRTQVAERRLELLRVSNKNSKVQKRRRPSKKLSVTLESLAAALPEISDEATNAKSEGAIEAKHRRARASLRSHPGVLRRKETLVKAEMRRFGSNLAQLALTNKEELVDTRLSSEEIFADFSRNAQDDQADVVPKASTASRFAMLRDFISSTMQQNPAFTEGKI